MGIFFPFHPKCEKYIKNEILIYRFGQAYLAVTQNTLTQIEVPFYSYTSHLVIWALSFISNNKNLSRLLLVHRQQLFLTTGLCLVKGHLG